MQKTKGHHRLKEKVHHHPTAADECFSSSLSCCNYYNGQLLKFQSSTDSGGTECPGLGTEQTGNKNQPRLIAIYSGRHSVPLITWFIPWFTFLYSWAVFFGSSTLWDVLIYYCDQEQRITRSSNRPTDVTHKWTGAFVEERCVVNKLCLNYAPMQVLGPCNISFSL